MFLSPLLFLFPSFVVPSSQSLFSLLLPSLRLTFGVTFTCILQDLLYIYTQRWFRNTFIGFAYTCFLQECDYIVFTVFQLACFDLLSLGDTPVF